MAEIDMRKRFNRLYHSFFPPILQELDNMLFKNNAGIRILQCVSLLVPMVKKI